MKDCDRPEPRVQVGERETLTDYLTWQRATFEWKLDELPEHGWDATVGVSTMTLRGLLKHVQFVEVYWAQRVFAGTGWPAPYDQVDWKADPDWDWTSAHQDEPDDLLSQWRAACQTSDEVYARADLSSVAAPRRDGEEGWSLRCILVHLIEEYARHNGHADLLRESVDGQTGE